MNIVFLDTQTLGESLDLAAFEQLGNVTTFTLTPKDKLLERVKSADVLVVNKVPIDKELMDVAHNLKLVCISATGMNNVDLEYAKQKGIMVKNVAGYSTHSVAQTTLTMILYLINKPWYFDQFVKSGQYSASGIFTHFGPGFWELRKKKIGIIGMGTIGKQVAFILEGFGAIVNYYSTSGKNNVCIYDQLSLDELLQTSDVVSIHAPLNENTRGLIDLDKIKQMKSTALLINAGRGGIVVEKDLATAIDEGIIAGAGVDVFETEPVPADNPLLQVKHKDRLVLFPHVAWISNEARALLLEKVAGNIKEWMDTGQ